MAMYEADQDAVGSGHQCVLNIVPLEIIWHLANPKIRSERHWPRVHHLLDPALLVAFQRLRCDRSEEHTSELQSLAYLVCRLLLEKKKKIYMNASHYTLFKIKC